MSINTTRYFTFMMLKPHLVRRDKHNYVREILEFNQLRVEQMLLRYLTTEDLAFLYSHVQGRSFWPAMSAAYLESPAMLLVLSSMTSPEQLVQTAIDTREELRRLYALTGISFQNAVHTSDSVHAALHELNHFFPEWVAAFHVE